MNRIPPLLPAETLFRLLRLARRDGTVVLAIAGVFALISAAAGDYIGALIGVVIAGAGVFELHGVSLLHSGRTSGMNWLVGSQLYLLVAVLAYVEWRLTHVDAATLRLLLSDDMRATLEQSGYDVDRVGRLIFNLSYIILAVLTVIYQGGMALHYHRRRAIVAAALAEHDEEN